MKTYFYLDDIPRYPGSKVIRVKHESWPPMKTDGSYTILPCRMIGLSYADYLRYCRDVLSAKVVSHGGVYCIVLFEETKEVKEFVADLNRRADYVIHHRSNI